MAGTPILPTIEAALEALRRDPRRPVRARAGDLIVEVRAVELRSGHAGLSAGPPLDDLAIEDSEVGESTGEILTQAEMQRPRGPGSR